MKTKPSFKIHLGIHVSVYLAGKQRRSRDLNSGAAQSTHVAHAHKLEAGPRYVGVSIV